MTKEKRLNQVEEFTKKFKALSPDGQKKILSIICEKPPETIEAYEARDFLKDIELCAVLKMTPVTMRRHLRVGPPRKRCRQSGDIRLIKRKIVGGQRLWLRESVRKFIYEEEE